MSTKLIRCVRRLSLVLIVSTLMACSSLPRLSYTPVDAQLGKENTQNTVAAQSNTAGDSNAFTMNSSTSMIAAFFAGGVLSLLTSLGFTYIIIKERRRDG